MKTYRLEFATVLEIKAENEEEAYDTAIEQFDIADLTLLETISIDELE